MFGWDLKGGVGLARNERLARSYYEASPATLVRIPIFPNAHRADGSIDEAGYQTMVRSIHNIQRVNPEVAVFASLKLLGQNTFPAWLCSDLNGRIFNNPVKKPDPERYARLIADYIVYLGEHEIHIDYLGLNNEVEGALTPDLYMKTAEALQDELRRRRVPRELTQIEMIGPDTFSRRAGVRYVEALSALSRRRVIDIAAAHTYVHHGDDADGWEKLARAARTRQMWFTEVHLGSGPSEDLLLNYRRSLGLVFDANRQGVTGYIWWQGAGSDNRLGAILKREVMASMLGARSVQTQPSYDPLDRDADAPLYHALRNGNQLVLWIINPGPAQDAVRVEIDDARIVDSDSIYWIGTDNDIAPDETGRLDAQLQGNTLTIRQIPRDSVAKLTFTLR